MDIFGEAPNIAARLQAAADPGAVLMSEADHLLVSGLFIVENRGALTLKGIEQALRVYKIIKPSGVKGRLQAAATAQGLTPFIDRESELRLLGERWELEREGEGQVALIIGETGIGKPRLLQCSHEQMSDAAHVWIESRSALFSENSFLSDFGTAAPISRTDVPACCRHASF